MFFLVAEQLCNKIGIIKDGRLVAFGPTKEVKGDSSLEDVFMELIETDNAALMRRI